ncbi:MAG: hypothetical protein DRJ44_02530 [Thermoprotei archaeon]|nr:MAG: hypothetical protein DRJ44_02530 [Thermoprotei archaeon]
MEICVFEDEYFEYFLPLTYTRPIYELRLGIYTLRERLARLGVIKYFFTRRYLQNVFEEALQARGLRDIEVNPEELQDEVFIVNGRLILDKQLLSYLKDKYVKHEEFVFTSNNTLVAAKLRKTEIANYLENQRIRELLRLLKGKGLEFFEIEAKLLEFPWELIRDNPAYMIEDLESDRTFELLGEIAKTAVLYSKEKIHVGKGAIIEDYVVLDARKGPIYIEDRVLVKAHSVIRGPTYIGKNSVITEFAKLREGSNIGESCGVGGEVVNLIMHGFVNKYHEGFVGRSYIGEWVNLGAATVTSDLKNTYGTVRFEIKGERIDTGLRKLGSFIGDMVRTAIGTKIYTGKKIGVAAQLYGIVAVNVPSFTIYAKTLGAEPTEVYLDSVLRAQKKFMSSRGVDMSDSYKAFIKRLFEITEEERRLFGVKKGVFKLA